MAKSQIRHVERKAGGLEGPARVGRVTFLRTGKTLYYGGRTFQSLKGRGFKANLFDTESNEEYWISGCRKDGNDTLYGGVVVIDEDAFEPADQFNRSASAIIGHATCWPGITNYHMNCVSV